VLELDTVLAAFSPRDRAHATDVLERLAGATGYHESVLFLSAPPAEWAPFALHRVPARRGGAFVRGAYACFDMCLKLVLIGIPVVCYLMLITSCFWRVQVTRVDVPVANVTA
jgi:hypothetical protein